MNTWETSGPAAMPPVPQMSDERVLERIRAGELGLYGVLVRRHHRHLQSVARRILKDAAEAEEAVQEAHMRVFTRLDQFGGRSSFLAYLTRIVANEALARIRARVRRPVLDVASTPGVNCDVFVSRAADPERLAINGELAVALRTAIEALPDIYRIVFRLREIDEMSVAQAARRLGLTDACVKTRLHRAKAILQTQFHMHVTWDRPYSNRPPAKRHGLGRGWLR